MPPRRLSDADYRRLLEFRTALRKFLDYSKVQAAAAGLTPMQHQLLLAVRGHEGNAPPTIGDLAAHLLIRHHSAVELVDRAEGAGLIERRRDPTDRRVVRVRLTRSGAAKLERVSRANLAELSRLAPELRDVWRVQEAPGRS